MDDFDKAFRSAQRGQTFRTIIWAGVAVAALYVALKIFA